ncbi:hypothetical protein SAMN05444411_110117 [Lutibacter oricola]|uniref:SpoIIAA-like n=1 Tax=Lutibacter oricola TaxID=762486 RepID=A0A1H3F429_9FLAO|nr:hypothetical protein [Lutibacter oricola]SDX85783.1 hypothetical protein SAMN05444411_110117 [Lutibacter oricola]
MIFSEYNESTNIIETNFKGEISTHDILNYIITLKEEFTTLQNRKIILDATKAIFNVKINELQKIAEANSIASLLYKNTFIAIIIDSPKNTVLSMLYKELVLSDSVEFNIFSTINRSREWLNNF